MKKIFFKKNVIFIVIGILVLAEILLFLFYGGGIKYIFNIFYGDSSGEIILFEGDNCAQCGKVDTFIKNNNVESKVSFKRLEVFNNTANANILADKAQICGLDISQIGVPFLWDGSSCIIGYVDVIDFLKQKISQKPQ